MKKYTLLPILLLFLSFGGIAEATNWCEHANIVGCWTVETGSGTNIDDKSSNNNDGTITGAVWGTTTPSPPASYSTYYLEFDFIDDVVDFGDTAEGATDVTVVMWVVWKNDNAYVGYMSHTDSEDAADGWWFFQVSGDAYIAVSNSNTDHESTTSSLTEDDWTHIGFGYKDSINSINFYYDGVEEDKSDNEAINESADTLKWGANDNFYALSGLDGASDEPAIFSAQLDSTDINDIMDNGLVQAAAAPTFVPKMMMF